MFKMKSENAASFMMLLWLALYALITFCLPKWAPFASIVACTLPMLFVKGNCRGKTFGSRNCNTVKYKKKEYVFFFFFSVSACALLSALPSALIKGASMLSSTQAVRGDFFYLFVFSCLLPAFFEEWLVRGGVLGAVSKHGGCAVIFCAVVFMLMHLNIASWHYTLFAGICITTLVYLTECIYLGMLLHFVTNFTSLMLSKFSGTEELFALAIIVLIFVLSFTLLRKCKLYRDSIELLESMDKENMAKLFTPAFCLYAIAACTLIFLLSYGLI